VTPGFALSFPSSDPVAGLSARGLACAEVFSSIAGDFIGVDPPFPLSNRSLFCHPPPPSVFRLTSEKPAGSATSFFPVPQKFSSRFQKLLLQVVIFASLFSRLHPSRNSRWYFSFELPPGNGCFYPPPPSVFFIRAEGPPPPRHFPFESLGDFVILYVDFFGAVIRYLFTMNSSPFSSFDPLSSSAPISPPVSSSHCIILPFHCRKTDETSSPLNSLQHVRVLFLPQPVSFLF